MVVIRDDCRITEEISAKSQADAVIHIAEEMDKASSVTHKRVPMQLREWNIAGFRR